MDGHTNVPLCSFYEIKIYKSFASWFNLSSFRSESVRLKLFISFLILRFTNCKTMLYKDYLSIIVFSTKAVINSSIIEPSLCIIRLQHFWQMDLTFNSIKQINIIFIWIRKYIREKVKGVRLITPIILNNYSLRIIFPFLIQLLYIKCFWRIFIKYFRGYFKDFTWTLQSEMLWYYDGLYFKIFI